MKTKEFKKEIQKYFEKNTGLKIKEAKEVLIERYNKDEFDFSIHTGNVSLIYNTNKKFTHGVGFFLTDRFDYVKV